MADELSIDMGKINFPSDKLTFGVIRRLHADQVDTNYETRTLFDTEKPGSAGDSISHMLFAERMVAEGAFLQAIGHPRDPVYIEDQKCYAAEASELYIRYGIASGPHHAQQLIRDVEAQAQTLARHSPGRRP